MLLEGELAKQFMDLVSEHRGHKLTAVTYGDGQHKNNQVNYAIECEDCSTVLIDADTVEPPLDYVTISKWEGMEQGRIVGKWYVTYQGETKATADTYLDALNAKLKLQKELELDKEEEG
jgi:hypothetical protein